MHWGSFSPFYVSTFLRWFKVAGTVFLDNACKWLYCFLYILLCFYLFALFDVLHCCVFIQTPGEGPQTRLSRQFLGSGRWSFRRLSLEKHCPHLRTECITFVEWCFYTKNKTQQQPSGVYNLWSMGFAKV